MSNEQRDDLLEQLGTVARQQRDDEREGQLALQLNEPLGEDFRAQMAQRLLSLPTTAEATDEAPADGPMAQVVPLRRARWVIAPVLAVAAVMILLIFLRPPSPLPYQLEVTGGDRVVRSAGPAAADIRELRPESVLEIVLRPSGAIDGPVALHAFVRKDAVVERWPVRSEISSTGAVRVRGRVSELLPGRIGDLELMLVVTAADQSISVADLNATTPRTSIRIVDQ